MQRWHETPANIVRSDLEVHHGDDSTTYRATAEYTYVFRDRRYTGTRVSLYGGADNIGSFQKRVHDELKQHEKSGRPFRCYIDPDDPAQSILYRELRWEMLGFYTLFVLIFGGAGFGMLFGGLYSSRKALAEKSLAAEHPDQPWTWREDWARGEIRSSGRTLLMIAWIFAIFWNLISLPALFFIPGEVVDKGNRLALLGLLFPAVGLGLLLWAVYLLLRWHKYGDSVFQMAAVPGVIGGTLAGVIRTAARVRPDSGFRLTLNCVRRYTTGSGDNRSTHEDILWQDERTLAHALSETDPSTMAIPVLFGIPYDARPSDPENGSDRIVWRLQVAADVPGIDYHAEFEVPVFKTAESRPDFQLDESLIAPYAAADDPDAPLYAAGVVAMPAAGGATRYLFPMARHVGMALGLTAFTAVWTAAIVLMLHLEAPIVFPIVFGLFDLLLVAAMVDVWFYRSAVDVSRYGLSITAGLFGFGRTQWIDAADVKQFQYKRGMQAGSTVYYNLVARLRDGKEITLGKRIPGRHMAEAISKRWEGELAENDKARLLS